MNTFIKDKSWMSDSCVPLILGLSLGSFCLLYIYRGRNLDLLAKNLSPNHTKMTLSGFQSQSHGYLHHCVKTGTLQGSRRPSAGQTLGRSQVAARTLSSETLHRLAWKIPGFTSPKLTPKEKVIQNSSRDQWEQGRHLAF